ncbi:hypothetical protein X975_15692, partial [Stegodyphus mimosarum]
MLEKAVVDNKDPYLVLLEYRNSPISDEIKSPSELMFGRKVNGLMPIKENFIQTERYEDHKQHLLKRQTLQKRYYDRNARPLNPLKKPKGLLKGTNRKEFAMQSSYENENHENEHVDEPDIPEIPSSVTSNLDVPVNSSAPNRRVKPPNTERYIVSSNFANGHNYVTRSGRTVKTPHYLKEYV